MNYSFFLAAKRFRCFNKSSRTFTSAHQFSWYENAHGINTSASLINLLFPLPLFNMEQNRFEIKKSNAMETIHRYYDLRENLHDIAPDLIIADGDINALRLAQRWKIPSVYIANLIRPSYGFSAVFKSRRTIG